MRRDQYLKHLSEVPMFKALSRKDLTLVAWTTMVVNGDTVTLSGTARDAAGTTVVFFLTAKDAAEPGRGVDTIQMRVPNYGYDRGGTLGGGNVQLP